jgi:NADH dehydrogenase FAD-containing subunit
MKFIFSAENQKRKSAHSIPIFGGGPTGVEFAGEIASEGYTGAQRTKAVGIHRQKSCCKTLKWLKSKNVEVKLDQAVNLNGATDGHHKISHTG